ncbi:unnamed protein product [Camellia sinensis]
MANSSNKITMFINMVLILSVLHIIITIAESRSILSFDFTNPNTLPSCNTVVGVESGDTCFELIQALNLTTIYFDSINPNLNCSSLFLGQWLCINGTAI